MTAGASDSDGKGEAKRQHYGITFAVLTISGASYALLQSAVAPALPDIQKELHSSETATAWLLTGYLLSASVMRTLGGSVGGQVGASLIAGTVVASGLPVESGFTLAFAFAAGACLPAAIASLIVPRDPGAPVQLARGAGEASAPIASP